VNTAPGEQNLNTFLAAQYTLYENFKNALLYFNAHILPSTGKLMKWKTQVKNGMSNLTCKRTIKSFSVLKTVV
jgi:hypothetical protein